MVARRGPAAFNENDWRADGSPDVTGEIGDHLKVDIPYLLGTD